jgi:hypothetical protein
MAEPPSGVVAGESVPVENDQQRIREAAVERVENVLQQHPAYSSLSEGERRETAIKLLKRS